MSVICDYFFSKLSDAKYLIFEICHEYLNSQANIKTKKIKQDKV